MGKIRYVTDKFSRWEDERDKIGSITDKVYLNEDEADKSRL